MDNTLQYSLMRRGNLKRCVNTVVEAFCTYEYFTNYFPDETTRLQCMRRIIHSEYRTTFGLVPTLVAEHNGEIAGVCQLFSPSYKKPTDLQYMLHGWLRVYMTPARQAVDEWLKMDAAAGEPCHQLIGGSTWYLSSITIAPAFLRQGIGQKFMEEYIEPYVIEHGGTEIVLFTNSEGNRRFYEKLGYQLFHTTSFTYNGHTMGSWSYRKEIK